MRKGPTARFANGVVSAIIVVFFIVHAFVGSFVTIAGVVVSAWAVWVGVVLIGVHVALSIVTSKQQLTDVERPPSPRKKRHLALKWVTGGALAAIACAHIVMMRVWGPWFLPSRIVGALVIVALAVALAVHMCVGSRSLLKDLEIDRRFKTAFRVVVCACAAIVSVMALVSACA